MPFPRRLLLFALPTPLIGLDSLAAGRAPWEIGDLPICRGLPAVEPVQYLQRGPADADADFLEKLGLLEGHLIIGRRLLEAQQARLAVPHFGHPVRELYGYLEPRLAARNAAQFEAELTRMENHANAGRSNTDGDFGAAWDAMLPKLRAAAATVPAAKRDNTRFMLEHTALMLYNVASDYGESIERGRIVNVVEYHDSMGFLAYARAVVEARQAAAPAWAEVLAEIDALQAAAYPQLLPAARPNISISAARARAAKVQQIADRVPA